MSILIDIKWDYVKYNTKIEIKRLLKITEYKR